MNPKKIALFDLDHTLLPIDSDYAWGEFTQHIGWCDRAEFKRQHDAFYAHYLAGTLDIHAYIRFSTAAIRQQGAMKSIAAHARFMDVCIEKSIKKEALALLEAHSAAGDELVIVTATNEFITGPIAKRLGVDELIAVELERGADGWFTGEIAGTPSLREGKVERVGAWLAGRGLDWDGTHTTFYSDSMNDVSLLEKVNVPVATNPDARLRSLAADRGWRILELFDEKK